MGARALAGRERRDASGREMWHAYGGALGNNGCVNMIMTRVYTPLRLAPLGQGAACSTSVWSSAPSIILSSGGTSM
eukprot:9494779-Pyramimonas_sp.AAC.1